MSFSDSGTFGRGQGCSYSVLISALFTAAAFAIFFFSMSEAEYAALAFIVAFIGAILIIGPAAVLIGLPLTQVLESNGWERPWSYPLAGLVFGGAIAYILAEAIHEPVTLSSDLFVLLVGALPGALCGALWWWFERRHRQGATGRGS
jgi:hypothetical protein